MDCDYVSTSRYLDCVKGAYCCSNLNENYGSLSVGGRSYYINFGINKIFFIRTCGNQANICRRLWWKLDKLYACNGVEYILHSCMVWSTWCVSTTRKNRKSKLLGTYDRFFSHHGSIYLYRCFNGISDASCHWS